MLTNHNIIYNHTIPNSHIAIPIVALDIHSSSIDIAVIVIMKLAPERRPVINKPNAASMRTHVQSRTHVLYVRSCAQQRTND